MITSLGDDGELLSGHRLLGETSGERHGNLPTQLGIVLFEDYRGKNLIRVTAGISCQEGQYVTGDTMLNFVETPEPVGMPQPE
jgi:hypothetical protein